MLHKNDNNLINLFLQLTKINALSGSEKPIANFIDTFLTNLGYEVTEDNSRNKTGSNTGNVICKIGDGGDFVLLAHMDTARPTTGVTPIVTENRITSSGETVLGVDNRAGVSVLLYTLEMIAKEQIPVKNFTVAFTTCEEATLYGSLNLELDKKVKKGFVFDSSYRPGNFIYSACGAIAFQIKVIGKASHSGIAPERGINALQIAARAISKLPLGRIDEETTLNIGTLNSGFAVNVIPEFAELKGEVRSFNSQKAENHFNILADVFKKEVEAANASIVLDHNWDFSPYTISENSDVYTEIVRALTAVGLIPQPKISLGGSDANSLNKRGIGSVNLGIGAQNPHGNDEFIYIEDLIKSAEIALELVRRNGND